MCVRNSNNVLSRLRTRPLLLLDSFTPPPHQYNSCIAGNNYSSQMSLLISTRRCIAWIAMLNMTGFNSTPQEEKTATTYLRQILYKVRQEIEKL